MSQSPSELQAIALLLAAINKQQEQIASQQPVGVYLCVARPVYES